MDEQILHELKAISSKLDALIQYARVDVEQQRSIEHVLRVAHRVGVFTPEQKAWITKVTKQPQRPNGGAPSR